MRRIRFIALKEFYHIYRDARSLAIVFAMPLMMTFLYGYAINMDINNITLAVLDFDHTYESRQLTGDFYNSSYFSKPEKSATLADPEDILRAGDATAVLIIRPGFGDALHTGRKYDLGMVVDGADNSLGTAMQAYANGILAQFLIDRLPPDFTPPGITIYEQVLYNPDLKSSHFFVPGLVAVVLMMISALLTSITLAREKETGTMEQLLTAPVHPWEIMIGKIFPYIIIAFIDGLLVILFAKFIFGVPFVGSKLLLFGFMLMYVASALSIGILISTLVKTQQVAMMFALVLTLLPSVMLSGFIFSIKNMPKVLQGITYIVPARYFLVVIRGIMLEGAGFSELAVQGVFLFAFMVLLLTIAVSRFKTRVG